MNQSTNVYPCYSFWSRNFYDIQIFILPQIYRLSNFNYIIRNAKNKKVNKEGWKKTTKNTIRGRGDYKASEVDVNPIVNKIVRKIGSTIGGIGGAYFGAPAVGAQMGKHFADKGHRLFKQITGYGDYTVTSNSLVIGDNVPEFRNISNRETRVIHKEYIGDLYSAPTSNTFKLQSFKLNPGNSGVFPWLSGVAQNYQQYRINGMIVYLKSISANALNSTNTNLGQVMVSTNYNVNAKNFEDTSSMLNAEFSSSAKPSEDIIHMIECAPRETTLKELYIRNSQVKVNEISDNRFYDYANVQIASSGLQANSSIPLAQMWISYDITLLKNISSYNVLLSDQYNLPLNSTSRFIPFNEGNTPPVLSSESTLGTYVTKGPDGSGTTFDTLHFPESFAGAVQVQFVMEGSAAVVSITPAFAMSPGVNPYKIYKNYTQYFETNMNTGVSTQL